MQYLFVYGSLKHRSVKTAMGNYYRDMMSELAEYVCDAYVPGRIYDLGSFPAAVYDKDSHNKVFGELWQIPDENADKLFLSLDAYEGTPHLYRREKVPAVVCDDSSSPSLGLIETWMYVWAQDEKTIHGTLLPNGEWSR